jgi:hypothetical protein
MSGEGPPAGEGEGGRGGFGRGRGRGGMFCRSDEHHMRTMLGYHQIDGHVMTFV